LKRLRQSRKELGVEQVKGAKEPIDSTTIDENIKFGLLSYVSTNIGDEIQALAQMRFLPRIDYYVVRERIKSFIPKSSDEKVKLLMNAWWMWHPKQFPPSSFILPLPISMHIRKPIVDKGFLKRDDVRNWFRKFGPVGCRDTETQNRLIQEGIPAYFSGCLTTTLLPNQKIRKDNKYKYIVCMNLSKKEIKYVQANSGFPVIALNKMVRNGSIQFRLTVAKAMLYLFHNAQCVITRNLHTALPCIAFGTPVLVVKIKEDASETHTRFYGLSHLMHMCTNNELLNGFDYDIDNPPPNPAGIDTIRDPLVTACLQFTNYDSAKSIFEDNYNPTIELLKVMQFSEEDRALDLYFASTELLEETIRCKELGIDKYDVAHTEHTGICAESGGG
jgi:hypothetical protein